MYSPTDLPAPLHMYCYTNCSDRRGHLVCIRQQERSASMACAIAGLALARAGEAVVICTIQVMIGVARGGQRTTAHREWVARAVRPATSQAIFWRINSG